MHDILDLYGFQKGFSTVTAEKNLKVSQYIQQYLFLQSEC